jgi:hypothetical protein
MTKVTNDYDTKHGNLSQYIKQIINREKILCQQSKEKENKQENDVNTIFFVNRKEIHLKSYL